MGVSARRFASEIVNHCCAAMNIEISEECDCLVARPVTDSLDYTVCGEFRDVVLQRLQQAAARRLVIDLQDVTFLDSLSIGALVSLNARGRDKGGRVALCGLSPLVANVLQMVTVDAVFEVFADVSSALETLCRCSGPMAAGSGGGVS